MTTSKILLTTSRILNLQTDSPSEQTQHDNPLPACTLKWRRGQLLVRCLEQEGQLYLPSLESEQWLVGCLKRSPVRLICIDPNLGETGLRFWADACEQANKKVFLKVPSSFELSRKCSSLSWLLKRVLDWSVAALLLLLLSPIMLGLMLLIRICSPGPVFFRQWRIGERGKLFRIIKFRTMIVDAEKLHHQVMANQKGLHKREDDPRITPLGRWMRKYSLDELPQLINVLRGEMSLVGPRPWALYDAVRISREGQKRLNALPGITGNWQVKARSNQLDIEAVNHCDLEYLHTWSLWEDLKLLLLTVPKVFSGFGAY
jgi:lipopolysaccharide/colanic/teichoic acid biosynthesis glycosyltransferase